MRAVQLQANISYTLQDKLNVLGGITYRRFSGLTVQKEAFGLLPLELNGSLHWKCSNKLSITSTLYAWDGAQAMDARMSTKKLPAAADFSVGATLELVKSAKFWVQLNNLLDNRYQRWNQYEVFGRNVVAGFVYSFSGK
jgi:outer membrane receptor for ferrienterochelin and colicin